MVTTLSIPAVCKRLATSLAVMGTLGAAFLSCLAYPKYGIRAVMELAELLLRASVMISISISVSFAGAQVG